MSRKTNRPLFTLGTLPACAILLAAGCAGSPGSGSAAPDWLGDKDAVYPPGDYLAEIGEGDSLREAKAAAAGAIAQIFRTRVTVDSTVRTRYSEITGSGGANLGIATRTDIDQSVGQSADESLSNLKFGESWQDQLGRVYSIAYLDRSETGNLYRQRIMQNDERTAQLIDRAESQDEALRRFAFLDAAAVMADANDVLLKQLEIISMPMARSLIHPYNLGNLRAARADSAAALEVGIEVSGDDEGLLAAALRDWATGRGFTVADRGAMALTASTLIEPVELDNDYENLRWELALSLGDTQGRPAASLARQGRSSGISESAARSRVYKEMTDMVRTEFDRAFTKYLLSFLEK